MPWFNERKAAQIAAFFALKEQGQINVLKLVKLIYLTDRKFMADYDRSILNDRLVSMDHGPVNSLTYSYISGTAESDNWKSFIADGAKHMVALTNAKITTDSLDELSEVEVETLEAIWKEFGHMDRFEIRDYTHENCPEWEDPHGSSTPIRYAQLFKFLGKKHSEELEDCIISERQALAKLSR